MPVHNADIARIFEEMADLLEIQGANPFRVRAYRTAARNLTRLGTEVADMLAQGRKLEELSGIGKDLAQKIAEIVDTGGLQALRNLQREVPPGVADLLRLPGLGPKRVATLYHELDIHSLDGLERAARDGRIRELAGFGAKTEAGLLRAIADHRSVERRHKLATAAIYADALTDYLKGIKGVQQVTVAGSFRRQRETVGDLDILVTARRDSPVMQAFHDYDEVADVVSAGKTRSTVMLRSGLQVDLRVVPAVSYGAALHYFTGSKAHNIAVRRRGVDRGLKINEYGVFRGNKRITGRTEAEVFAAVGLPYIEPELRENQGEIEAAEKGELPELVTVDDLRGDLHAHTTATDGRNSLAEMAAAAADRGFAYLAITEHSQRLTMTHGLDAKRLRKQGEAIDRLNADGKLSITVLKGIEVDILEDGSLDLPDEALGDLDLVVGAVHHKFDLSRERQTERILRAMDRPCLNILAHPSGRLIQEREPYDVDMVRIIRAAADRGCFLELNAHPERLDLIDSHCRMAREAGVLVAINSDAHGVEDFDNLRYGVGQARRGWLGKADVLNTRPLNELKKLLARRR
jgi:DNA polymerase (family 10)